MKQWETSELYREVKSRPSEDGSLPFQKDSEGFNTEARRRCLHLLEYSPRTVYQLKKRLMDDGFSAEQTDDAIRYAESFGYVDDGNYAMEYVRTGCQKKSRRQLYMQLSSRGVDKESIEDALEAYADEQENTVRRLARKRLMQKPPRTEEDFLKAVKRDFRTKWQNVLSGNCVMSMVLQINRQRKAGCMLDSTKRLDFYK